MSPRLAAPIRVAKGAVKDALQRLPERLQPARVRQRKAWAIGIYTGSDPLALRRSDKPVLTKRAVSDVPADFVADPFMIHRNERWFMFMEVLNRRRDLGEIGLAVSDDGRSWRYDGIVLREPFHLSYPLVLEDAGEMYLVPETEAAGAVRLYRAVRFPSQWAHAADLLTGRPFRDPTLFRHDGRWWMFTETGVHWQDGVLRLYHAERLTGPWQEHPDSPVVDEDARIARPAGRVIQHDGGLIRFAQDCSRQYGKRVYAVRITELSTLHYAEEPLLDGPVLEGSGAGWDGNRLHHIDLHRRADGTWLAAVDGH